MSRGTEIRMDLNEPFTFSLQGELFTGRVTHIERLFGSSYACPALRLTVEAWACDTTAAEILKERKRYAAKQKRAKEKERKAKKEPGRGKRVLAL